MRVEKLSQSLRQRIVVLAKEILALNATKEFLPALSFNRVSGAIYHELLKDDNLGLSEDEAVNLAVNMTREANLVGLLARYDEALKTRAAGTNKQVFGLVNNMVPMEMENREEVIADTLDMLARFRLVKSIAGIRALIQARLDNSNQDLDELDFLHLR
jgi:hypothetical protein